MMCGRHERVTSSVRATLITEASIPHKSFARVQSYYTHQLNFGRGFTLKAAGEDVIGDRAITGSASNSKMHFGVEKNVARR